MSLSLVLYCLTMPVSKRTFGVKYDSYTRIKLFITSNVITYYHHFNYHIPTLFLLLIFYTFLYRFISLRKDCKDAVPYNYMIFPFKELVSFEMKQG